MLSPNAIARSGLSGRPVALPHRSAIERSYGVSLDGVYAYTDPAAQAACRALGKQAFAIGNRVAFATASPDLHVAAHEAAHTLEDPGAAGVVGGSADSEAMADAAADRVVAGNDASDLVGSKVTDAADGTVRFYTLMKRKTTTYRVADDGSVAVRQDSACGGMHAYATPEAIEAGKLGLAGRNSSISLAEGGGKLRVSDAGGTSHLLSKVVPVNARNKTRGSQMELWADCGRSARTVTGADGGSGMGNGSLKAQWTAPNGAARQGGAGYSPEIHKVQIMVDWFGNVLDMKQLTADLAEYDAWCATKTSTKAEEEEKDRAIAWYADKLDRGSRAAWDKLTDQQKLAVEKAAGINRGADPAIGEGYHMSTGGNTHPGLGPDDFTWNFHWAGVVMKSAGENCTLENYSVNEYDRENREWVFQLYGVPRGKQDAKAGQTFQEEHRDTHMQHGTDPTTMRVA